MFLMCLLNQDAASARQSQRHLRMYRMVRNPHAKDDVNPGATGEQRISPMGAMMDETPKVSPEHQAEIGIMTTQMAKAMRVMVDERIVAAAGGKIEDDGLTIADFQRMDHDELMKVADKEGLEEFHQLPKQDLIFKILKARAAKMGIMFGDGTLQIMSDGFGFLRSAELSYMAGPDDIYVSPSQIRRFGLRRGMTIRGAVRPPKESERYFALLRVEKINGRDPNEAHNLVNFEDMVPMHPDKRLFLETTPENIEMRIMDLVSPIGMGQRALIVAPPRTGKTVLMQKITSAINTNYPEAKVIVLLVDERPEEVTDFKRNVGKDVEVVASTFDEQSNRHLAVADMVSEKARRLVEFGEDVVILLDSITRLARAYNNDIPHSGKIMSGGLDSNALQRPKKFFGSARAIERGGSLTIIGTALKSCSWTPRNLSWSIGCERCWRT